MANEVNVFEMTNMALKNLYNKDTVKESVSRRTKKTLKKESVKRVPKFDTSRIRVESLKFMKEADSDDFEFTPEDDVVVVIDPEMEEVPTNEEDAAAAAEELVGDTICKCSVCGANYVCDCADTIEEDVDGETETVVADGVCPVCGEDGAQIVVGEIVPATDADVDTDTDVDTDVDDEFDDTEDFDVDVEEEEDIDVDEGCKPKSKKESTRRAISRGRKESMLRNKSVKRPMRKESNKSYALNRRKVMERKAISKRPGTKSIMFDESALNRLFNTFAKENYSNIRNVRFTKGSIRGNKLTVEGVVTTVRGSKRPVKLVSENYKKLQGKIQFKEVGPFTESVKMPSNRATFVVEYVKRGNAIKPVSMKYSFRAKNATSSMKESRTNMRKAPKTIYEVKGSVK